MSGQTLNFGISKGRSLLGYLVVSAHLYDVSSFTFHLRLQCDFSKCLTKTLQGSTALQTVSVLWFSGCGYNLQTLVMLRYSKINRQEYILSICYFFFNLFNITSIFMQFHFRGGELRIAFKFAKDWPVGSQEEAFTAVTIRHFSPTDASFLCKKLQTSLEYFLPYICQLKNSFSLQNFSGLFQSNHNCTKTSKWQMFERLFRDKNVASSLTQEWIDPKRIPHTTSKSQ